MTYFFFILTSALEDFQRNKMRTILTSLGILIGVSSVVMLIAFGLGLKAFIKNQFDSLGSNLVYVLPGKILNASGGFRSGGGAMSSLKFDERDLTELKKIKEASYVVGAFNKSVNVSAGTKTEDSTLSSTSPDYFTARTIAATQGRLFDKTDNDKRSKVIVIGPKIARNLFQTEIQSVGKSVKIDGLGYKIIGVTESKGGGFGGPDFDSYVYMPYKTAYVLNPDKSFASIFLKADTEQIIPLLKQRISQTMLKRYKEDDFSVVEQTEILKTVESIFSMLNLVLVAIATISLIVGGVGIMNIMYVSVTERIREIGIRRAIGATQKDILYQFLAESVLLSLIGGLMGLLLAFIVVLAVRTIFPAYIDAFSVSIALGVSSAVGIIFGVFPARKAAALSPIDAIRYE